MNFWRRQLRIISSTLLRPSSPPETNRCYYCAACSKLSFLSPQKMEAVTGPLIYFSLSVECFFFGGNLSCFGRWQERKPAKQEPIFCDELIKTRFYATFLNPPNVWKQSQLNLGVTERSKYKYTNFECSWHFEGFVRSFRGSKMGRWRMITKTLFTTSKSCLLFH